MEATQVFYGNSGKSLVIPNRIIGYIILFGYTIDKTPWVIQTHYTVQCPMVGHAHDRDGLEE